MYEKLPSGAILTPVWSHIVWFKVGHEGRQAHSYIPLYLIGVSWGAILAPARDPH